MMQSGGQGYDRGVTVFSPDGRLYQVEYAREAVRRGGATVGVCTDDSVILAAHGPRRSPLVAPESIEKVHDVDGRIGIATAGHVADGRRLVDVGRQFAARERLRYGEPPGVEAVATAVADFVQESTQTGGTRPFGAALLVGGVDEDGARLYEVDPSGTPTEWYAAAVGNGAEECRSLLEDEYESGLDDADGRALALRALSAGVDDGPTAAELDLGVLSPGEVDVYGRDRRAEALADADL